MAGALLAALAAACNAPAPPPRPPDPERVIAAALALEPDQAAGRGVFRAWCIFCHGDQAAGEPPTDFDLGAENPRRFRGYELGHREHVEAIVNGFVSHDSGRRNMPAFALRLTPREIADVAAYERTVMALSPAYRDPPSEQP
ncbi:MAG: cytochrome c [Nitrospirae bacterium]|nr:cytochrome c [Nitrospirota bacterium]